MHNYRSEKLRLLLSKKGGSKVVRPRSDRGLRSIYEDQSKETEDQALISVITFLTFHNCSLMKPDSCKSLVLQDYHNQGPDN